MHQTLSRLFVIGIALILISSSHADNPPIKTQADVDKLRVEILSKLLLDPYKSTAHDQSWNADGEKLIDLVIWHMQPELLDDWSGNPEIHDLDSIRKLARKVVDAGCDEPNALLAAAWVLSGDGHTLFDADEDNAELNARVWKFCADERVAPLVRFMFAEHLRLALRRGAKLKHEGLEHPDRQWIRYAVSAIESKSIEDRELQAQFFRDWQDEGPYAYEPPEDEFRYAILASNAEEWLKKLISGSHELRTAWVARGMDYSIKDYEGFHEHLALARKHFQRSIELAPDVPFTMSQMITVAMGDGDFKECRQWLVKAIDLQIDHLYAWDAYLTAAQPKWYGSNELLAEIGLYAAKTKAFNTRVPWLLIATLYSVNANSGEEIVRTPEFFELLQDVCEGYRQSPPPGFPRGKLNSNEAALAFAMKQWQRASECLEAAGTDIDDLPFRIIGTDVPFARLKCAGMTSEFGDRIRELIALKKTDLSAAIKGFDKLLSQVPSDHRARAYLAFGTRLAHFERSFATGMPTPVLNNRDDLMLWKFKSPTPPDFNDNNELVYTNSSEDIDATFRKWPLGNYVFRGTITFEAEKPAWLGKPSIYAARNPSSPAYTHGFFFVYTLQNQVTIASGKFRTIDFDYGDKAEFEATVINGRMSVTINGKLVAEDCEYGGAWRDLPTVGFAIDNAMHDKPSRITLSNLSLQRLDDDGNPITITDHSSGM